MPGNHRDLCVRDIPPFGLNDGFGFSLADGISGQVFEDIAWSSEGSTLNEFPLFHHMMDSGEEFSVGHGTDGLGMGMSGFSFGVVECSELDIPFIGIFSSEIEVSFVSVRAHLTDMGTFGLFISGASGNGIETSEASVFGKTVKAINVSHTGLDAGSENMLDTG